MQGDKPEYSGLKPELTPFAFGTGLAITFPQSATAVNSQAISISPGKQKGLPSSIIFAKPKKPFASEVAV